MQYEPHKLIRDKNEALPRQLNIVSLPECHRKTDTLRATNSSAESRSSLVLNHHLFPKHYPIDTNLVQMRVKFLLGLTLLYNICI